MVKGRRIHTAKFRRCVREVEAKSGGMYNPYAVCTASIKKGAFLHKRMPRKAIEKMLASPKTPAHLKKYWRARLKKVV